MNFLQGLHGVVALILLCSLLFAEEAGVPLPFAPGEAVLLAAGLLIGAGGLDPVLFVPLAIVACVGGASVGYSWARLVGTHGLLAVARRLHQEKRVERAADRVRSAGPVGIAISRLVPGFRIYTTLIAGALQVPRRVFLVGMAPATAAWVVVFVLLGALVGVPVQHFLDATARLALQGGILLVIGIGGYVAVRRTPASSGAGLVRLSRELRIALAIAVDIGVVASLVTGLLAVGRRVFGFGIGAGWLDAVIALAVVGIFYVVITRRGAGGTVGETLLQTAYVTGRSIPMRPQEAWRAAQSLLARPSDALQPAADVLRTLGDANRLRLLGALLEGPRTPETLVALRGGAEFEVAHDLEALESAGLAIRVDMTDGAVYRVRDDLRNPLILLLAAIRTEVRAEAAPVAVQGD